MYLQYIPAAVFFFALLLAFPGKYWDITLK
jgi:hypothetical protein